MVPIMNQLNQIRTPAHNSFKLHFNIIPHQHTSLSQVVSFLHIFRSIHNHTVPGMWTSSLQIAQCSLKEATYMYINFINIYNKLV
jgi:hypothetical protein